MSFALGGWLFRPFKGRGGGKKSPKQHSNSMQKLSRKWTALRGSKEFGRDAFRVLQWNVLADGLAQNGDFVKVSDEALEWETRWPMILDEIRQSGAHVICLQEVNTYDGYFKRALDLEGYDSFFLPKNESPATKYGASKDGSTIFFKTSRFSLSMQPIAMHYDSEGGSLMPQGLIAMQLHDKLAGKDVVIATTHLKAKNGQGSEDTRLKQVSQLLDTLSQFRPGVGSANGNGNGAHNANSNDSPTDSGSPILVCGDFNDVPSSPCCSRMTESELGFKSVWDEGVVDQKEGELISTYKFRSTGEAKRTIDYVWHSDSGQLIPTHRWLMPSAEEIGDNGLPGFHYPSDHLAVCVEFKWRSD